MPELLTRQVELLSQISLKEACYIGDFVFHLRGSDLDDKYFSLFLNSETGILTDLNAVVCCNLTSFLNQCERGLWQELRCCN